MYVCMKESSKLYYLYSYDKNEQNSGDRVSLRMVHTNIEEFLHGLRLCGKSKSQQGLLESKKKIGGNHAFFRVKLITKR